MNKYEKILRAELEAYRKEMPMVNTPFGGIMINKECWVNTKNAEYEYRAFPLWGGNVNENMEYETIHTLMPKMEFEGEESPFGINYEEWTKEVRINEFEKLLYLMTKEVRKTQRVDS